MKTMLIATIGLLFLAFTAADTLTGRWETKPSPKGNVTGVLFKADHTYVGYINKKPFTSGTYTLQDGIVAIVENGCQGRKGVYKLNFSNYSDSLRFEAISDSCTERRAGMQRLVLGRVK